MSLKATLFSNILMYVVYSVHTFTTNQKLLRKTFVAELMAFSEVVKSSSADVEDVYTFQEILFLTLFPDSHTREREH